VKNISPNFKTSKLIASNKGRKKSYKIKNHILKTNT